jgi:hypothetical protein
MLLFSLLIPPSLTLLEWLAFWLFDNSLVFSFILLSAETNSRLYRELYSLILSIWNGTVIPRIYFRDWFVLSSIKGRKSIPLWIADMKL